MKRFAFFLLLLSLVTRPARAQLNAPDTLNLQVRLTASGSYLAGNVRRLLLINRLELAYAQPDWGLSSRNDYQYGYTGPRKTEDDVVSWNFLYRHPLARVYPYLMLLAESNFRRKLTSRVQPGAGLSWNVWRAEQQLLRLSATASWEQSRYRTRFFAEVADTTTSVRETWRLTGRLYGRHRLFGGSKLRLTYEGWYQQSVRQRTDYRYLLEGGVEVPVAKHVAIRAGARYTYERVGPRGFKPEDLFVTYGISLGNF